MSHVSTAIDKYGGRYKFAKDMEVTWAAVDRWYKSGTVPPDQCVKAADLLGVSTRKLNEDMAKIFT